MNNENIARLIRLPDDVFYNIIKYLTVNETLKLKLVSKGFFYYLKGDKAYSLNSCISLNNYIHIVNFVDPQNLRKFFLSILNNENNIYINPNYGECKR
ncbi:F-box domain containing protein, putative, partial [Hepatocystis sp. ex Piliocolobus tephrosceles]